MLMSVCPLLSLFKSASDLPGSFLDNCLEDRLFCLTLHFWTSWLVWLFNSERSLIDQNLDTNETFLWSFCSAAPKQSNCSTDGRSGQRNLIFWQIIFSTLFYFLAPQATPSIDWAPFTSCWSRLLIGPELFSVLRLSPCCCTFISTQL